MRLAFALADRIVCMKLLLWLERKLGRYAIPHVTMFIVVGQALCYLAAMRQPSQVQPLELIWERLMRGEAWRAVTFIFIPVFQNPVFLFFGLYFFWIMGTALEN